MNFCLNSDKLKFAEKSTEWSGFYVSQTGIKQTNGKVQGITDRLKPETLKEFPSFLGAVNLMTQFMLILAQHYFTFRPLLKNASRWAWREEHDKSFSDAKDIIWNSVEVTHLKWTVNLRRIDDASRSSLDAVLQQRENNDESKPIHFASRFLTVLESEHSTNKLELLAVVWFWNAFVTMCMVQNLNKFVPQSVE